jgi:hypothetical protein
MSRQQMIENPMIHSETKTLYRTSPQPIEHICDCGNEAKYEVYANNPQKHCERCMLDAVDCEIYVEVRTL